VATIELVSDQALAVVFDEAITEPAGREVRRLHAWLEDERPPGVVDLHPAYVTLLVRFDPLAVDAGALVREIERRLAGLGGRPAETPRVFEVPVRYGGDDGPDLPGVAAATGLREDEVVALHAGAAYEVRFLGFAPGFPYLAGLPDALATSRHATPRRTVAAGSVAIAGRQAGIYPLASPGGWNVIGRTDLVLFDAGRRPPALMRPGDLVHFAAVRCDA